LPNSLELLEIKSGFLTAEEFKLTLSAPALKRSLIEETESISAGLDYPGVSPLHCFLKDVKRARYTAASDEEALNAYKLVTKYENLRPSLEPSHAFFVALKEAKKLSKDTVVVINSCGDAYKDKKILEKRLGKKYVKSN